MKRPSNGDYAPFYAGYIKNVPDDVIKALEDQLYLTNTFFKAIPADKIDYRYAEGKWSIKEIVGHLIDNERIMSYRALSISRNETQSLPGFDENDYMRESNYSKRNYYDIVDELRKVRESNLPMFKSFSEEILDRRGVANNSEVTVRALLFIIAGHEIHHINIVKERYFNKR
ncbi:MAG: damage-inducible protein DinB [Ignavibacteria bacterium GWA2_35_9]|nr:MAG: damage-inducible protein DinB [Ignavibacteria bacterium GWA2_35_9]OGU45859.1 MAG: damage-inducible protein DinB [Ignavibacteria bacterium GWB2_36_8]OGU53089.1 MAG: damage-inducible protein DinB [Ignavibacteria bacterium GWC2_36_12]